MYTRRKILLLRNILCCKFSTCLLIIFTCTTSIQAQNSFSNQRQKAIYPQLPQQVLDSLSIIPNSVQIKTIENQIILDTSFYKIQNNRLIWNSQKIDDTDAFEQTQYTVTYRVFPYQFEAKSQHLDTLKMERSPENAEYLEYSFSPEKEENSLFNQSNLDYSGSFSRGISVGNNQNLVLNSNFNLQMAGKVGDVEIAAAISDANIPLQPEGNTQQLQDFDKVYIQIKKDQHQLLAGDYELTNNENYFLRFYKKLQGLTYSNTTNFSDKAQFQTQASVALARGKFARNFIIVQEGNQGPYRLQGNNNEQFIILLAGTERVYVDGQLKKRGIENDYIVDYNRGEITFTAQQLITKDRRVIVEFEYSDQNFLRSLYAFQSDYQTDKTRLYFNLFSQQDSKNTSGLTELSASDKQVLANIGDNLNAAIASGVRDLDDTNPVTYKITDTLVNGILYDSILVFTVNENEAQYTARFSDVGFGNGNYIRDQTAANGTVFEWIAPDEFGNLQGNFEPLIQLIAPISQQVYVAGIEQQIGKKSFLHTEVALSRQDLNRFSKLDAEDNLGLANFTQYRFKTPLSKKDSLWQFSTHLSYEFKQRNFQALNPYRNQEFVRDWNVDSQNVNLNEHIGRAKISLEQKKWGNLNYEYSTFLKGSSYTGRRHFSQLQIAKNGFQWFGEGNWLNTESELEQTQFSRPKIDIAQTISNLKIGAYFEQEKNERQQADTLALTSFQYDFYKIYLQNQNNEKLKWDIFASQRFDFVPFQNDLQRNTKANNLGFNGNWNANRFSRLRWNFTYRQLDIERPDLSTEQATETYLGRLEYNLALWKGALKSSTTYEIGAGQEPRLEYNYLKVNPGEGVYQWNDYNQDSIQQVNEFEIAINPDQAQFVRVAIVTNDFIRSNNIGFNQNLSLQPRAIWYQKEEKIYKFINKLSSQSVFKINRKTRFSPEVQVWNPFQLSLSDTSLVATTVAIRNTLFFNRTNQKYDIQAGFFETQNQVYLTTGFEKRGNKEQFLRARWNVFKPLSVVLQGTRGERRTDSEFFNERDYQIAFEKIELLGISQFKKKWQLEVSFIKQDKTNRLTNLEQARQNTFSAKLNLNQSTSSPFQLGFSYSQIDYKGDINTPVAFALLESLQPGRNFMWNLDWNRQVSKNIQLNLGYEGRKNGDLKMVHIGRMQLRAVF